MKKFIGVVLFIVFCFSSVSFVQAKDIMPVVNKKLDKIAILMPLKGQRSVVRKIIKEVLDMVANDLADHIDDPRRYYNAVIVWMKLKTIVIDKSEKKTCYKNAMDYSVALAKMPGGEKYKKYLQDTWREYLLDKCKRWRCYSNEYAFMHSIGDGYFQKIVSEWLSNANSSGYYNLKSLRQLASFCKAHKMQWFVDKELVSFFLRRARAELYDGGILSALKEAINISSKNNPQIVETLRFIIHRSREKNYFVSAGSKSTLECLREKPKLKRLIRSGFDKEFLKKTLGKDYKEVWP